MLWLDPSRERYRRLRIKKRRRRKRMDVEGAKRTAGLAIVEAIAMRMYTLRQSIGNESFDFRSLPLSLLVSFTISFHRMQHQKRQVKASASTHQQRIRGMRDGRAMRGGEPTALHPSSSCLFRLRLYSLFSSFYYSFTSLSFSPRPSRHFLLQPHSLFLQHFSASLSSCIRVFAFALKSCFVAVITPPELKLLLPYIRV